MAQCATARGALTMHLAWRMRYIHLWPCFGLALVAEHELLFLSKGVPYFSTLRAHGFIPLLRVFACRQFF